MLQDHFDTLWREFCDINPQAKVIHDKLSERGENVVNDHVAFRTFEGELTGIEAFSRFYLEHGYKLMEEYEFKAKKLRACHLETEGFPKIFISELSTSRFPESTQELIRGIIDQIDIKTFDPKGFSNAKLLWKLPHKKIYDELLPESEYAAWLYAFGFRANHFTVSFNHLKGFEGLTELNEFIEGLGFTLNASGGKIKGSKRELLEQSSTLAAQVDVAFKEGSFKIPSCYYEFARRYPQKSGTLFQGFISKSADKIFESTDSSGKS